MRKYIGANLIEQKYINKLVLEDHNKIRVLEESFQKLEEKRKDSEIYFNGQIYDAYSKILDIFKSAIKKHYEKYNKEYHNLDIKYDNTFHDRYFMLDNSIVYHCGASINKIGYKTFSITKIGDKQVIEALITQINKIT